MDIKLLSIQRHGAGNQEYVKLKALKNCNIGDYLIADTTYYSGTNEISNKFRHAYFFPDYKVEEDDLIILYTGKGESSVSGHSPRTHKFYWGVGEGVWNEDKDCAILLKIQGYNILTTN